MASAPSFRDTGAYGAVLYPFRGVPSPTVRLLRYAAFILLCIALGAFYGFAIALLPPLFLIYISAPILVLVGLVVWALPDQGTGPVRLVEKLFFAFLIASALWPIYLSIALPGVPWISLRRLLAVPLVLLVLVCLSVSSETRGRAAEALKSMPPVWKMVVAFVAVQFATTFWAANPFSALNYLINYWLLVWSIFFASILVFTAPGRMDQWVNVMIACTAILCFLAGIELYMQRIPWAEHIPAIFQIDDIHVREMLTAKFREGEYRVTGVFTTSLSFAEFLAIASIFITHRAFMSKTWLKRIAWATLSAAVLAAILATKARLGVFGWLAGHGLYGSLWVLRRWKLVKGDVFGPALAFGIPIAVALFFVAMFTVDAVRFRTIGGGSTSLSDDARRTQFELATQRVLHNPFGYGASHSGETIGYRTPSGLLTVDSYVLSLVVDYGLIGLTLFFGALLYAIYRMIQTGLKEPLEQKSYGFAIAAALVVYISVKLVLSQEDNLAIGYMLLAMAVVHFARSRPPGSDRAPAA